jgi:hypothetical protein
MKLLYPHVIAFRVISIGTYVLLHTRLTALEATPEVILLECIK